MQIGTNSINIVLVDTTLSSNQTKLIYADLQDRVENWSMSTKSVLYNIVEDEHVGYISNTSWNPYYYENILFPNLLTTNNIGKLAIEIPKSLSDVYTNAFAWAETNSNKVVAATEFALFLSSSNFVNTVTSNTVHNYGLYERSGLDVYAENFHDITNSLLMYTYYPPSILGFEYNDRGPDPTNLWVKIPTTFQLYGKTKWSSMPAIWHDGKWKISFWGIRY